MHGYALAKHIKLVSDDLLQIEEGSLYPALQRMLKRGYWNRNREFPRKAVLPGFTGSPTQACGAWSARSPASKDVVGDDRVLAIAEA